MCCNAPVCLIHVFVVTLVLLHIKSYEIQSKNNTQNRIEYEVVYNCTVKINAKLTINYNNYYSVQSHNHKINLFLKLHTRTLKFSMSFFLTVPQISSPLLLDLV